jgi:hypothetical protein
VLHPFFYGRNTGNLGTVKMKKRTPQNAVITMCFLGGFLDLPKFLLALRAGGDPGVKAVL